LAGVLVEEFEGSEPQSSSGKGKGKGKEQPDDQYIEILLLQVLQDEFDTHLEDGSAEEVAKDLCAMWDEVLVSQGQESELVKKFEEVADKLKGKKTVAQVVVVPGQEGVGAGDDEEWASDTDDEDEDEDDGAMQVDGDQSPQLMDHRTEKDEPVVDEDGFTLVKKGARHPR
jgi:pre-rRNA-processing protein TSR2